MNPQMSEDTVLSCAAEVGACIVVWAKLPEVIASANKTIQDSTKLKTAIDKLGGLQKALEAIKQRVADQSKLAAFSGLRGRHSRVGCVDAYRSARYRHVRRTDQAMT